MSEELSDSLNETLSKYFLIDSISNENNLISHFVEVHRVGLNDPSVWDDIEQQVSTFIDFRKQSYTYVPQTDHFLEDLKLLYNIM